MSHGRAIFLYPLVCETDWITKIPLNNMHAWIISILILKMNYLAGNLLEHVNQVILLCNLNFSFLY